MISAEEFKKYYRSLNNEDLLEILANKADYQPMAIEAAQEELNSRNLSGIQLEEAAQILLEKKLRKEKKAEKIKAVENKIKNAGNSFIDTINPIQQEKPTTDKIIKIISLVYGGIFLYTLIQERRWIVSSFKEIFSFPLLSITSLIPIIILPIAVLLFHKRKTFGWILLVAFVSSSVIGVLWAFVYSLSRRSTGFSNLGYVFPRPSSITYFIQLVFLGASLYMICKTDIRLIFRINKQRMISTIVISGLIGILLMLEL